ncbi:hypothetical protein O4273_26625 [Rhodococcus ruber]|uniref:hypothetical protein n=1 Tax=Rhodococcus ruber TaxID=1830 RepID=UPI0022B3CBD8|nr:hypothetical protein [Rhodococcus ruber]MCZ4506405.1 hypothetical protein [Rhodococcus ruber]
MSRSKHVERARRYDDELRRANTKPVGAELHRRALLKELDDVSARLAGVNARLVDVFDEFVRLRAENRRLRAENDTLQTQLDEIKSQRDTYDALSNQPVRAVH